jgi:arsenate reductase
LLNEHGVSFEYREYKKNPLTLSELQNLMTQIGEPANTLLRKREKAYKELGLSGTESDETLLPLFVKHPALMQRPIFVHEGKAVLCRPHERLLDLL